ncbi:MAG: efflux RND transporter periplasmic adaptor subunit [Nitrospirae bacterium]|nr:efflux RND transporter periplasmic adaptor subunit [Nitrospirota bacterium]
MRGAFVRKFNAIRNISGAIATILIVAALATLTMLAQSCTKDAVGVNTKRPQAVIPVTAAMAVEKDVPVELRAVGNVEAYSTVSVKSLISGQLQEIHFKEGQDVKKGDLLFTIDPRTNEVALKQAEAAYARDLAQMENAKKDARRYEELAKKEYVAVSQYDQYRTAADALEATVKADKASIDNAKLQLSYCFIYSPVTGRTGSLLIHKGNLIKASDDNKFMVVINQVQPIYVNFAVPAQYLPDIKRYDSGGKLAIEATQPQTNEAPEKGVLTFIDNAVDNTTGTIHIKGTFDNNSKSLWPGEFVNVRLTLTVKPHAVVVPSQTVMTGQSGQFVYVIKPDSTVDTRYVTTGIATDRETVIDSGLKTGEQVVTDGQLRLVSGSKVSIKGAEKGSEKGGDKSPEKGGEKGGDKGPAQDNGVKKG